MEKSARRADNSSSHTRRNASYSAEVRVKMASALSRVSAIAMEATRDFQDRMRAGNRQQGGEIGEIRGKLDSRFEGSGDLETRSNAS